MGCTGAQGKAPWKKLKEWVCSHVPCREAAGTQLRSAAAPSILLSPGWLQELARRLPPTTWWADRRREQLGPR